MKYRLFASYKTGDIVDFCGDLYKASKPIGRFGSPLWNRAWKVHASMEELLAPPKIKRMVSLARRVPESNTTTKPNK